MRVLIFTCLLIALANAQTEPKCTEGDAWDQTSCDPKKCVGGEVVVDHIECPDPASVTCPAGEEYAEVDTQCCPKCISNSPPPPQPQQPNMQPQAPPRNSPIPPFMNMRKYCEGIMNPNMCLMKNGCQWKPMKRECGQLNCEKIFGWQNC